MEIKKMYLFFKEELKKIKNINDFNNLQSKYLGKNSEIVNLLKNIKNLTNNEKKIYGKQIHELKNKIFVDLKLKKDYLNEKQINEKLKVSKIDISLPGIDFVTGKKNPLYIIEEEIYSILQGLGYKIIYGKEIDTDFNNFQLLNIPKNHPARNLNDTFYIDDNFLLRTHCTNTSASFLKNLKKKDYNNPVAIISIGNVYRRDTDDATHLHQFSQIDGLMWNKNISFANLKWTLKYFCKELFGEETKIRLRPSYFPFTKLSVEVDITCPICNFKGCNVCKKTGWIEVLGAGLLNPKVLELCEIDNNSGMNGLAFGIGIERIAMIKYGISNIRDFYNNDLKFLSQFKYF